MKKSPVFSSFSWILKICEADFFLRFSGFGWRPIFFSDPVFFLDLGVLFFSLKSKSYEILFTLIIFRYNEILKNGKYGKLVPTENPKKLAVAIYKNLRKKHNKNSLIKRSLDFEVDKISNQYLKLIKYAK